MGDVCTWASGLVDIYVRICDIPITISTVPVRLGKEEELTFQGIATVTLNESLISFVSTEQELSRLIVELQGVASIAGLSCLGRDDKSILYQRGDEGRERVKRKTFEQPVSVANVVFEGMPTTVVSSGRVSQPAGKPDRWKWSKNNV